MRNIIAAALVATVLCAGASYLQADDKKDDKVAPVLKFKMNSLDGKPVELSKYLGKVILLVNVASKCGNTPQYETMEKLYEKYGKDGFMVVGVPANNFNKQEPGSNEEIAQFCKSKYSVTFDMLAKVSVKGNDQCDLYKYLTSKETNPKFGGDITWNFEKFLINRKGEVVARFKPSVKPDSKEVVEAIEAELKKK